MLKLWNAYILMFGAYNVYFSPHYLSGHLLKSSLPVYYCGAYLFMYHQCPSYTEQNRTEQNRTEQNRTERKKTDRHVLHVLPSVHACRSDLVCSVYDVPSACPYACVSACASACPVCCSVCLCLCLCLLLVLFVCLISMPTPPTPHLRPASEYPFNGFIRGILRGVRYAKSLRVLFLHRRSPSWTTLVLYSRAVFIFNEPTICLCWGEDTLAGRRWGVGGGGGQ